MATQLIPLEGKNYKHGHAIRNSQSGAYVSWRAMLNRCTNPSAHKFELYGGSGKTACCGLKTFTNFLFVLGDRPPGFEIDRWPNKSGNYSCGECLECLRNGWPLNVRWASQKQQNRNTQRNRMFTVLGITACFSELCEHFGVSYGRARARFYRMHWPIERALFTPKLK
jgi:hypothetical protein